MDCRNGAGAPLAARFGRHSTGGHVKGVRVAAPSKDRPRAEPCEVGPAVRLVVGVQGSRKVGDEVLPPL